ncbi:MAG: YraN family protein [Cyanobacteriota bacterium]|nr:YraN family protein [Cyanobacteriota bacterium]
MPICRGARGAWAEHHVSMLLQRHGWRQLDHNWPCRWGELDLVMHKPGRLLLVEVKGRGPGSRDGAGRAALTSDKRRRLQRAWGCWLAAHPHWAHHSVEWVAALVALPPLQDRVRWLRLEFRNDRTVG